MTKKHPIAKGRARCVQVRMTEAEFRAIAAMAKRSDLSISSFVRQMAATHAKIEAEVLRQAAEDAAKRERALMDELTPDRATALRDEVAA